MRRYRRISACALAAMGFIVHRAGAIDRTYSGPVNGLWLTSGNWTPVGAPGIGDNVFLPPTYVGSYTVNFGAANYPSFTPLGQVFVSSQFSQSATIVQDQPASSMAAFSMHLGANGGTGIYNQSAGINTITSGIFDPGLQLGENFNRGIYNLSGGTLSVESGRIIVGNIGDGTFNQTGGANNANDIRIGLNDGAGSLTFTGIGTYNLSGGTLNVAHLIVGDTNGLGTFLQSGGTVSTPPQASNVRIGEGSASFGRYQLSAGTLITQQLGIGTNEEAEGLFVQSGGVVDVSLVMVTGSLGTGTYNLIDGSFSTEIMATGNDGVGHFNQSGGSVTTTSLGIGLANGGSGTHRITGGTLTVDELVVGGLSHPLLGFVEGGTGTLVINSGAVVNVNSMLRIVSEDDTVQMSGGTLNVATIDTHNGGRLNFTGGAINFTGSLNLGGTLSPLEVGSAKQISVAGTTTISGGSAIRLNGGTFATGSLSIAGGTLEFTSGTLRLNSSGLSIAPSGPFGNLIQLNSGQRIDLASNNSATLAAGAQLRLNGGSITSATGTLSNSGLIFGSGIIQMRLNQPAAGEIRVLGNEVLRFQGLSAASAGRINLGGDAVLEFTSALTNTGTIAGRGSLFTGAAGLINNGTINLSGGFADIHGPVSNGATSRVVVTGGSVSTFYDSLTNVAGSEFRVSTGATAVFLGPVTGLDAFTGGGEKIFEGTASGGPLATGGESVVESGGLLTAQHIRENALTVLGVAALPANGTDSGTSRLNVLSIEGTADAWTGTLDLFDNALVIDYTGASPLATIANQIRSGYQLGQWKGTGISSGAAAQVAADSLNPYKTALGFAEASAIGISGMFNGQPIDETSIVIDYTFAGDANLDGVVNALDFNALATHFGEAGTWLSGDFNYDGTITTLDFDALATNFNQALPSPGIIVPEPAAAAGVLIVPMIRRRRRARFRPQSGNRFSR